MQSKAEEEKDCFPIMGDHLEASVGSMIILIVHWQYSMIPASP